MLQSSWCLLESLPLFVYVMIREAFPSQQLLLPELLGWLDGKTRKGEGDMPLAFRGRAGSEWATLVVATSGRAPGDALIEATTAKLF